MACSPPGSNSCHGIFQAKMLEWVAIPFSRGSSWLRGWTRVSHCRQILYHLSHQVNKHSSWNINSPPGVMPLASALWGQVLFDDSLLGSPAEAELLDKSGLQRRFQGSIRWFPNGANEGIFQREWIFPHLPASERSCHAHTGAGQFWGKKIGTLDPLCPENECV